MSIKSNLESSKSKLDALLTYANGVTGASDVSIGDAIRTLAEGYGGGGGEAFPDRPNICRMFNAILNGTCKRGTFRLDGATLPAADTLIFDSGLDEINGFVLIDSEYTATNSTYNLQFLICEKIFAMNSGHLYFATGVAETTQTNAANRAAYCFIDAEYNTSNTMSYTRLWITDGKLYARAQYDKHNNWTLLRKDTDYIWLAW